MHTINGYSKKNTNLHVPHPQNEYYLILSLIHAY